MSDFVDFHSVELRCPTCGQGTSKTISWLRQHEHYVCEACGTRVDLNTDEFRRHIRSVQETAH